MKKTKIFGIGAGILLMLLALFPAINALSIETNTTRSNILQEENIDYEQILYIIQKYEKEINEIEEYINDYIDKHGFIDIYFELPEDLKEKYETILKEGNVEIPKDQAINYFKNKPCLKLSIFSNIVKRFYNYLKINSKNPFAIGDDPYPCGGKTDYNRVWIIPYVAYVDQVWLDSTLVFWICKTLGPIGFAAIGIALTLSGVGAPIAIAFAIGSLLSGFGLDQIYEMGRETGLYCEITDVFMYDTIPPILTYMGPQ